MEKKEKDELVKKYGFSEDLMEKIEHSIDVMRKAEGLALEFYDKGFYLCFSGGKDSQCLYHLAILAGVKFEANMNMTSVDPPQVVRFVKNHYQNIVRHAPEINFYQLIIKKKSLPFSTKRFCCDILKERGGANTVSLVGIRAEESKKRAGRNELEIVEVKNNMELNELRTLLKIYDLEHSIVRNKLSGKYYIILHDDIINAGVDGEKTVVFKIIPEGDSILSMERNRFYEEFEEAFNDDKAIEAIEKYFKNNKRMIKHEQE